MPYPVYPVYNFAGDKGPKKKSKGRKMVTVNEQFYVGVFDQFISSVHIHLLRILILI